MLGLPVALNGSNNGVAQPRVATTGPKPGSERGWDDFLPLSGRNSTRTHPALGERTLRPTPPRAPLRC
jgi:hypothetical protein